MTDTDVVLPTARGFRQPLAAVYRTALAGLIANLAPTESSARGCCSSTAACSGSTTRSCSPIAVLARFDPDLESVMNVNTPDEYEAARARPPAEVTVQCFGALASAGRRGPRTVRAATLGAAAAGR